MDQLDPAYLQSSIDALISLFFWKIDHRETADIARLFTADAVLVLPDVEHGFARNLTLRGGDAVAAQWSNRPDLLVTRHLFSNLQVCAEGTFAARGRFVGTGYRHCGQGFGAPNPVIVADHDDTYRRDTDGSWRIASKTITPIFVAPALFDEMVQRSVP